MSAHQELIEARVAVNRVITERITTEEASRAVKLWLQQVKVWEEADVLSTAFTECRLTFRYMIHPDKGYNFKKENPNNDPTRERLLGIVNNDRFQKDVTNSGKKNDDDVWVIGGKKSVKIKLDGGGAGIVRRTNPENFTRGEGKVRSNKHSMGLHALSASLLNPEGHAAHRFSELALICFMPLPFPADVKIFYGLRALAKTGGCVDFQSAVVMLGTKFTRPQFAAGMDMGAQYVVVKSARHGEESVKYVRGTKNQEFAGQTPTESRRNAVNDYQAILATKTGNEITVAYRQHGLTGTKFPIFAIGDPGAVDFPEVVITIPVVPPPPKYGSPKPRDNPFYTPTGRVINAADFTIR